MVNVHCLCDVCTGTEQDYKLFDCNLPEGAPVESYSSRLS